MHIHSNLSHLLIVRTSVNMVGTISKSGYCVYIKDMYLTKSGCHLHVSKYATMASTIFKLHALVMNAQYRHVKYNKHN